VTDEAPQREIVGITDETINDEGRITIVGKAAAERIPELLDVLNADGIDGRRGDTGNRMARIRVHVERIPDALRSIHRELFEREAEE